MGSGAVMVRKVLSQVAPQVRLAQHENVIQALDYALTRLGTTLTAPLHALYRWTERHLPEIRRTRAAADNQNAPPP
jgi:DNA-binding HxlR family transcriptional regulator